MMLLHVCRTRVARSPWKIVSHSCSTSSVKGNLEGQAWLTQVPCLVRRAPEECNIARYASRASMDNTGPTSREASEPMRCGYSLWANVPWRGNGAKTGREGKTRILGEL